MSQRRVYPFRIGHWLPKNPKVLEEWLKNLKERVRADPIEKLDPLIQEFKEFVENDATLHMQYSQMFSEVTTAEIGKPIVNSYDEMFLLVNHIMKTYTPPYSDDALVGFPINAILNWAMGTTNGYAAFLNEKSNHYWKKVLDKWQKDVLKTGKSLSVFTDKEDGWFSKPAMKAMTENGSKEKFMDLFQCNPKDTHLGFTCWDDFFTRKFRKGARPIEEGENPAVINNCCESFPYSLRSDVKMVDDFWIKDHKYSLKHLLNDQDLASQFVGGTVYQAFLSALSYHRWHSPIKGTVIKTYVVPGTYYSATQCIGPDEASPDKSQGYICQVATRAVVVIQADNADIGKMCIVFVGMAEVSTCEVTVKKNDEVEKGDEIGMFHFGGSTHCLIFGPKVELNFINRVYEDVEREVEIRRDEFNIHVNAKLATVAVKADCP